MATKISPNLNKLTELKARYSKEKSQALRELKDEFAEMLHKLAELTQGLDVSEKRELLSYDKLKPSLDTIGFEIAPVFIPPMIRALESGKMAEKGNGLIQTNMILAVISSKDEFEVRDIFAAIKKKYKPDVKINVLRVLLSRLVKNEVLENTARGKYRLKA